MMRRPRGGAMLLGPLLVLSLGGCRSAGVPPAGGAPPTARASGAHQAAAGIPRPYPRPTTEQGCRSCDGVWAVHGIATTASCNCRTRDGGRRCRDGAECEGACVSADSPDREVISAGPPPRGYFVGRCSELFTVFGCNRFIDRGASSGGPVPLDEPPPQLCVD